MPNRFLPMTAGFDMTPMERERADRLQERTEYLEALLRARQINPDAIDLTGFEGNTHFQEPGDPDSPIEPLSYASAKYRSATDRQQQPHDRPKKASSQIQRHSSMREDDDRCSSRRDFHLGRDRGSTNPHLTQSSQ